MPTSLWWNHLSDYPLVQWGIIRGASQEASLPKGAIKKKKNQQRFGYKRNKNAAVYKARLTSLSFSI